MSAIAQKPDLRRIGESVFTEVVLALLSMPVTVQLAPSHTALPSAGDQIVSRVSLASPQLSGGVQVQFPLGFVALAVRRLIGVEGTAQATDALLDDAAGELANMVAGRVAAQLAAEGFPCKLGTPAVVRGEPPSAINQSDASRARTDFACEGHALSVEVHCRYAEP